MLGAALVRLTDEVALNQMEDCVIAFLVCLVAVSVRDDKTREEEQNKTVLTTIAERLLQVGWVLVIAIVQLFGTSHREA